MITLIDGDLITYRCAASAEKEDATVATARCDELIRRILSDTGATSYELWLNGPNNYRKQVDPQYKAHRTLVAKPIHLEYCRDHLVANHNAQMSVDIETDDELGLAATAYWESDVPFCVASLDKDLLQLRGKHYNFVKNTWTFVSPNDAAQTFWKQMLIGDRADNVVGVEGIGTVKAGKAINPLHDERDMYSLVHSLYNDDERFKRNAQLLWILKHKRNPQEVLSHFHTLHAPDEEAKQ